MDKQMEIMRKHLQVTETNECVNTFFAYKEAMNEWATLCQSEREMELEARIILQQNAFNDWKKISDTAIDGYKAKLKSLLPEDCIHNYGEVKFCPSRLGEGDQCKHCV